MLEITITLTGRSATDIELALDEVGRKIQQGYVSGGGSNDSGSYHFETTGEDDAERLTAAGWEWADTGWLKGRMKRERTYEEALKEEFGEEA